MGRDCWSGRAAPHVAAGAAAQPAEPPSSINSELVTTVRVSLHTTRSAAPHIALQLVHNLAISLNIPSYYAHFWLPLFSVLLVLLFKDVIDYDTL